jgi:hypothetical protein
MTPPTLPERAAELIRSLDLTRHPEGGYYREAFRSAREVTASGGHARRSALTAIYFLLLENQPSRWHVVGSDEVWHFYEGAPLDLYSADPDRFELERMLLGPVEGALRPVHAVPAGHWQAARTTGEYTLAGCTVGPGFDFADFKLARNEPAVERRLREAFPALASLI